MEDEEDYINVLVLIDECNSASESINKDKPCCIQIDSKHSISH
jgi:hypothetical protein